MKIELSGKDTPLIVKNIVQDNYIEVSSNDGVILSTFFKSNNDKKIIIIKRITNGIKVFYFNDITSFSTYVKENKSWNGLETIFDSRDIK